MQPRLLIDISTADLLSIASPAVLAQGADCDLGVFKSRRTALPCLSARSGFHALLQTLALPAQSPIIYSAITIETMVAIAQEHQLATHFVDVDPATMLPAPEALDALLTQTSAKVVVIAQLYGCVSSLQAHAAVCQKHGALLVEDCAQAFSGDFHLGDAASDFSLFSFGPIKRFTALGGGVIVGQDADRMQAIANLINTWPRKSDAWFIQRALKFLALKIASIPFIYTALLRSLSLLNKDADALIGSIARGFQAGRITPQLAHRMSLRQQRLLSRRLNNAKHSDARSQSAMQSLHSAQQHLPNVSFQRIGTAAQKNAYWLMPVLVDNPSHVVLQLRKRGIDATQGATSMRAFGTRAQCPNAHHIMQHVVYLPMK
ncbi:MAG: DegT/DnrJ/EryC1/StrS aminotransferase family protein [Polaromonas sp.]|nr:DegT/DnrJ/EryC1/StrS aminotransferase family protein [Polaromonas sp.]